MFLTVSPLLIVAADYHVIGFHLLIIPDYIYVFLLLFFCTLGRMDIVWQSYRVGWKRRFCMRTPLPVPQKLPFIEK